MIDNKSGGLLNTFGQLLQQISDSEFEEHNFRGGLLYLIDQLWHLRKVRSYRIWLSTQMELLKRIATNKLERECISLFDIEGSAAAVAIVSQI